MSKNSRAETANFCTRIVAAKENKESPIVYIDGKTYYSILLKEIRNQLLTYYSKRRHITSNY